MTSVNYGPHLITQTDFLVSQVGLLGEAEINSVVAYQHFPCQGQFRKWLIELFENFWPTFWLEMYMYTLLVCPVANFEQGLTLW